MSLVYDHCALYTTTGLWQNFRKVWICIFKPPVCFGKSNRHWQIENLRRLMLMYFTLDTYFLFWIYDFSSLIQNNFWIQIIRKWKFCTEMQISIVYILAKFLSRIAFGFGYIELLIDPHVKKILTLKPP